MPTITRLKQFENVNGKLREEYFDFAFDSSYPSGGEDLSESSLGGNIFKQIAGVEVVGGNAAAAEYLFHWDTTNKKLIVSYPTGGSAAPASLADPATTVPAGATPVTSDAAQPNLVETAGRGEELADTTDASSLTVRLRVTGI